MFRLFKEKKGFTLVETMVTLVLVGILLAGSVAGVSAYVDYSNYKTNNEYARTLFMTTQSALAYSKASGALSSMRMALGSANSFEVPSEINDSYDGRLQYLLIDNGQMDTPSGKVLRELIGDYVFDEDVFNATICVELDLTDGVVHSVLYSRQAASFNYTSGGTDPSGTLSINKDAREYSMRRRTLLGYYDSDLPEREPGSYGKPTISYVKLDNGEVLDLHWALTRKHKLNTGILYYTVELYDANNIKRLALLVNSEEEGTYFPKAAGFAVNNTVKCRYEAFNEHGAANGKTGELALPAYVTPDAEVHLILDVADFAARDMQQTPNPDYANTWSAMRLSTLCGEDFNGDVYARVKAAGSLYASSAAKQSNTENMFLGKKPGAGGGYTLQNARHLFNLRFTAAEQYAPSDYTQTASFSWGGNNGLLKHGCVVETSDNNTEIKGETTPFPAIDLWPEDCTLSATGTPTIGDIILREETGTDGTALFLRNLGTIEKLTFTDVDVEGGDYVAVLAARNGEQNTTETKPGMISNVTVKSGTVRGDDCVGGIMAVDESIDQVFTKLVNGADITGDSYVGGVVGSGLREGSGSEDTGELKECKNTGAVRSDDSEGKYIGGIIGCNFRKSITECTSSPKGDMGAVLAKDLKGAYVGGIAGLNVDGDITKCSTGKGVVCGKEYVGGIVGLNVKAAKFSGDSKRSQADVIGEAYVGGITGANVETKIVYENGQNRLGIKSITPSFSTIYGVPNTSTAKDLIIESWSNEGLVCATKQYSGGIAGYNCGLIQNCSSNVSISSVSGQSLLNKMALGKTGDYAGGIAGCNRGEIIGKTNNTRQNLVSVVAGRDYVGGVAGLNAATGRISNFTIAGGYISGRCFAGGFVGLNCSRNIYETELYSSPNLVEGNSYVGGVFGGSIVRTYGHQPQAEAQGLPIIDSLTLDCNATNFLGSITADGVCAGGFIGYHALLGKTLASATSNMLAGGQLDVDDENLGRRLAKAVNDVEGNYYNEDSPYFDEDDKQIAMQKIINKLDDIAEDVDDNVADKAKLKIGSTASTLYCRLHDIQGYAYVGGVIGYNCTNTKLSITNVQNQTPITATGYVTENNDDTHYSYAGGIIGRASEYTLIDDCANASSAIISHKGTYAGGLVEVNEGTVQNCTSSGSSQPERNWLGGFVGLNRVAKDAENEVIPHSGYIYNCNLAGSLTGGAYTGGIVAENRGGIIKTVTVSGNVSGRDADNINGGVGGVAAKNTGSVTDATVKGNIASTGNNVGGIAGENGGSLIDCTVDPQSTVQGKSNVGGFIGRQIAPEGNEAVTVQGLTNNATVTGDDWVGGIVGRVEGKVTIKDCVNNHTITANAGSAGGITALNGKDGTIQNCTNSANIYAPESQTNGGISAVNEGIIVGSQVKLADGAPEGSVITITGKQDVGGIAAQSSGKVQNCTIGAGVTVTNREGGTAGNVGGIAGINKGAASIIENCTLAEGATITVNSVVGGGTLGGVAGKNEGSITGKNATPAERQFYKAAVTLAAGLEGYTGGITGWNTGSVANYTFAGSVSASGGESYGYGCIAGVNGNEAGIAASIKNCAVDDAVQRTLNNSANNETTNYTLHTSIKGNVRVGGIAGLNCAKASIENSTLIHCYIRGDYGYVGGIAGQNLGSVSNCSAPTAELPSGAAPAYQVKLYLYQGDLGGIVGRNERTGTVNDCATGNDWMVLVAQLDKNNIKEGIDNTCAGVMGYNCSDESMANLVNYARVRKILNNSYIAGGIIGRNENITTSGWTYSNFKNYGDIEGQTRAAGIIAQWKYNGGTLDGCENYGEIKGNNAAGGIIGSTYGARKSQRLYIMNCVNHGKVSANDNAGGIVGHVQRADGDFDLTVLSCANTGEITTNSAAGGMIGRNDGNTTSVVRCVNYYRFAKGGAVSGVKIDQIKYCINVPVISNSAAYVVASEFTDKAGAKHNYYLALDDTAVNNQAVKLVVKDDGTGKLAAYNISDPSNEVKVIPELNYDPNAAANAAETPRGNYDALHLQLVAALEKMFEGTPGKPTSVTLNEYQGDYEVTWGAADNAYYYVVTIQTRALDAPASAEWTTEETVEVYGDERYEFDAVNWQGKQLRVTVAAHNSGDGISDAEASTPVTVREPLITPQVCYELMSDGKFVFRLLNRDAYVAAYDSAYLKDINITATYSTSKTFTVEDGRSGSVEMKANDGSSLYMSAYASPKAKTEAEKRYLNSVTTSVQTQAYGTDRLKLGALASMKDEHFTGIRPSELWVVLTLTATKQAYSRTELLVNDAELGVPVAISSDTTRISGTHVITLKGLEELTAQQSVTVRSYAWGTQNLAEMFGHEVAKNKTALELATLTDPVNGNAKVYDAANKVLTPGYVLVRTENGNYDVFYSVLLANGEYISQILKSDDVKITPDAVATPVLEDNYDATTTPGKYRFEWNKNQSVTGANYEVAAYGLPVGKDGTADSDWLSIRIDPAVAATTNNYIELDPASWAYKKVRIEVTRLGTTNNKGNTATLGSTGKKIYDVPLALPKMSAPVVSFDAADRDKVQYNVSWTPQNGAALEDTKEYQLYIKPTGDTVPTLLATIPAKDGDTAVRSVVVNLEAYQDTSANKDKPVYLSIKAILKDKTETEPANYNNSSDFSDETTLSVERRINLGDGFTMVMNPLYNVSTSVSVADFTGGITLSASAPGTADVGSFILQTDVYNQTALENAKPKLNANGEIDTAPVYPVTANESGKTVQMTSSVNNSLTEANTYAIAGMPAKYAGQYVIARARAISANMVSSLWTDHFVFRLPRVKLDTTLASPASMEMVHPLLVRNEDNVYVQPTEGINTAVVTQQTMSWLWDENSAGYDIALKELGTNANYSVALRKAGGEFTLTITTPPTAADPDPVPTSLASTPDGTGALTFTIPQYAIEVNGSFPAAALSLYRIEVSAQLTLTPGTPLADGTVPYTCTLVLPDYLKHDVDETADSGLKTFEAAIKTIKGKDVFDDSDLLIWRRVAEADGKYLFNNAGFIANEG